MNSQALQWDLARGYTPINGRHDELMTANGEIRPLYKFLLESINQMGPGQFAQRRNESARLLQENGVTYNIYQGDEKNERLWRMDPLPVLISSEEWSTIEPGLIQRAELFELALNDLYSEQTLIREKIIPPDIIFRHPGYLRAAAGTLRARGQRTLPMYAADLVRHSDGILRVVGDRTQSPSGAGYALENRVVLSRIFPSLYRDSHVHRLALFFRAFRTQLTQFKGKRPDEVQVGLLTPGPGNETYFEHAYLAGYLGLTLVQGGDLTVKANRLFMKTVEGLQPLDVLLRRVDDLFSDPLELKSESLLGPAGLLNAVRNGNLWVANPVGCGVLENSGLFAYLPKVCRHLLGEDLIFPMAQSWWCGDPSSRTYVEENLSRLILRPLARSHDMPTIYGPSLSNTELNETIARIRHSPENYTAQEILNLSTAPVCEGDHLTPRPLVLRSFLAATGNSFSVLPGGLGRVASHSDEFVVTNQRGAYAKDVWILASEPERTVSLMPSSLERLSITRSSGDLPSRTADNLFWLGRYAERTEDLARMLREATMRISEGLTVHEDKALRPLLQSITRVSETYPGFDPEDEALAKEVLEYPETELNRVIYDANVIGSIVFNLQALVGAARSVRDRLSGDGRRIINSLDRLPHRGSDGDFALDFLHEVISSLLAFSGLNHESMTRGPAWRFMELGRRVERAMNICASIKGFLEENQDEARLEALLLIHESHITYRRRYRHRVEATSVIDLLLMDESNPRGLASQLVRINEHINELPAASNSYRRPEEKRALEALTKLRLIDPDKLFQLREEENLSHLLDSISDTLVEISNLVSNRYFNYIEQQQNLDKQL
ncbi:MAG: circularly permuted type 2 ATP-grasp protein [Leptospiraceae bacterium]|nr:circularly permuted type 2 ATP-grasp protein [Leptospiraceae bacterium]